MDTAKQPAYRCPLCKQALTANAQGFACTNKHQFDQAKEGYVNLLPVQNKGSKIPGDSQAMVQSRRDFLACGAYDFLRQAVVQQVKAGVAEQATVLDVGCGEGYYTHALNQQSPEQQVYGVDIAKAAIRYAAKRFKSVHFTVASHIDLPVADDFADIICKIFAPVTLIEVVRVLKPGGLLLSVVPGPKHLFELKQIIYDYPKLHQAEICPEGFELITSEALTRAETLSDPRLIGHLTQMTPFAWKLSAEKKQALVEGGDFAVTFDFVINVYRLGVSP